MCAAEYALGKYCGVTFAGIKPASLFTFGNEEMEMLPYYERKFRIKGFIFVRMSQKNGRTLIFVYHKGALKETLFSDANREFLQSKGYDYQNLSEAVCLLRKRLQEDEFPHEIGVFLGYPLDDVKGYIACPTAKTQLCGYWKVYCDEEEKQKIFNRFDRCTNCICRKMLEGQSLTDIFKVN